MLANLDVSGTGFSTAKWNAISNPTIANGQSVSVSVATGVAITGWKIQKDSSGFNDLQMTNSFTLPSGNKQPMSLTVKCGEYVSSPINFVTPNCPSDVLGKINVTYDGNVTKTWSALPATTSGINNKSTVKVDVSQVVDKGDWKLKWQYNNGDSNIEPLTNWSSWTSGELQGNESVTLTLQCGNENPSVRKVSR